jgi:hypothetical protein
MPWSFHPPAIGVRAAGALDIGTELRRRASAELPGLPPFVLGFLRYRPHEPKGDLSPPKNERTVG